MYTKAQNKPNVYVLKNYYFKFFILHGSIFGYIISSY